MEQNRFRYLSVRVIALLIAALCLAMFQTAACLVQAFRGNAPCGPALWALRCCLFAYGFSVNGYSGPASGWNGPCTCSWRDIPPPT